MAETRRSTPEKQLLNFIESEGAKGADAHARPPRQLRTGIVSPGAWRGRLLFLKDAIVKRAMAQGFTGLDIKAVNNVLALSTAALIGYMGLTVYQGVRYLGGAAGQAAGMKEIQDAGAFPDTSPLRAITYYVDGVMERNIFKMGRTGLEAETPEIIVEPAGERLFDLSQNLRLVGISWSDEPDAMIEDTESMRTFFVKRGQMVGKLKVQAILKDKVILSYEGAEVELK